MPAPPAETERPEPTPLVVPFLPIAGETIRLAEVFQMGSSNKEWTTHGKTLWITGGLRVS